MTGAFAELAAQIAADGTIASDEILILRRTAWSDGKIDRAEAEAILAIDRRITTDNAEWRDFFVEAIGEYLLKGEEPFDQIDAPKAQWLTGQIDRGDAGASRAALALLARLFERASSAPDSLRVYGVVQIERALLAGDGRIDDGDAHLLRRLIFAPASDRAVGVSRAEAELLLRLKDRALDRANGGEWQRLFVQGLGNYLTAYTSYEPLTSERGADLEDFRNQPGHGLGRLFAHLAQRGLTAGFNLGFAGGMAGAEPLDPYEQALVDFIAEDRR